MENSSKPLATESFSYSWLVVSADTDTKPQSYDDGDGLLRRHNDDEEQQPTFDFDVPFSESPANLAHADEIFSNGHIKPIFLNRSLEPKKKKDYYSTSAPQSPEISHCNKQRRGHNKGMLIRCLIFVKKRFLVHTRKSSNRVVDDLVRKVCQACDDEFSSYGLRRPSSSPWLSPPRSCPEAESSIHEAILYCKRSIGK